MKIPFIPLVIETFCDTSASPAFIPLVIETVSLPVLDDLVASQISFESSELDSLVSGFSILRRNTVSYRMQNPRAVYSSTDDLRFFEKQSTKKILDCEYDVNVVARTNSEILGVFLLRWEKYRVGTHKKDKIWNYNVAFIEVKDSYRNKGIASDLLEFVEQLPEIQNKVIRFGKFKSDGTKYIRHIIPRIFSSDSYLILPQPTPQYKEFPPAFGCYLK